MPEQENVLEKRKANFTRFYEELIPVLVEFIGQMGITPAQEVLHHAVQYASYLGKALEQIVIANEGDRLWLTTRVGYFVGEYFAQKYAGHWYVNDICGSRYYARYVVGKFANLGNHAAMIDPFAVADVFVKQQVPRELQRLLSEVDRELMSFEKKEDKA
jgi:hypothetical protein